eukprot:9087251-Karenia_brevis.AAC.1
MPALESVCKEMGVPWERTRNFVTERIPDIVSYYLLAPAQLPGLQRRIYGGHGLSGFCLLYTSDAAGDMQCVDLGGR